MTAPQTPGELAAALGDAAAHGRAISLAGNGSKRLMAGPTAPAECAITTAKLNRVIEYEPRDLTISVEAGLPWRELTSLTARNRLMAPLDPPFAPAATVGGNCLMTIPAHTLPVTATIFSMDGSLVVSGSDDGTVCLWSA